MNYDEFYKRAGQGIEREQILKDILKEKPMKIEELMNKTGFVYHQIQTCLISMYKKNRGITKRKIGVNTYWGLTKEERG